MEHPKKILGRMEQLDKKIERLKLELTEASVQRSELAEIVNIYSDHFTAQEGDRASTHQG